MSAKEKLAKAKQLIQAKQYDKARELLWDIDHPTATKWLQKLDAIAPAEKTKPAARNKQRLTIGLLVGTVTVVAIIALLAVALMSGSSDTPQVNNEQGIDESQVVLEAARQQCREFGYRGIYFDNCLERELAYAECGNLDNAEWQTCLDRLLPTIVPIMPTREPTATPTIDVDDFPTFTPTPQ